MKRVFGQALWENRPHLVGKRCLTPFISPVEFAARREALLKKMPPRSLAIVPGNVVQFASPSVFYPFRQDPNFQYLTGFLEPDACLLLHNPGQGSAEELLFVPEKDPAKEQWEGERTGSALATEIFGIPSLANTEIKDTVTKLMKSVEVVYADTDQQTSVRQGSFFNKELPRLLAHAASKSVRPMVEDLRLVKSENEIDCLRQAAEITAAAYNRAYKVPFESEHQLHAFLDFMFKQGGCESDAYLAVVAGGAHALTIHYVRNDDLLHNEDLVLVDAGGRFGGYCADISRTWPVGGRFSSPQRELYEAVLETNKACIKRCVPGEMSLYDLHSYSESVLRKELLNAGLELSASELRIVYPHMIGHNLGLDVHDAAGGGGNALRPNQVITIEPGVYIPFDNRFPQHFQGIGIRVEDNVAVGPIPEVLTEDCLKEVSDIER